MPRLLTDKEKLYIRDNYKKRKVVSIAAKLGRDRATVKKYVEVIAKEPVKKLQYFEVWISGKFVEDVWRIEELTEFQQLSNIHEKYKRDFATRPYYIFKRIRAVLPEYVEEKAPYPLRSVPLDYTERKIEYTIPKHQPLVRAKW